MQHGGQGLGQSGVEEDLGWCTAIVKDEKKGERSGRFPPESPRLNIERQRSAAGTKDSNIVMGPFTGSTVQRKL